MRKSWIVGGFLASLMWVSTYAEETQSPPAPTVIAAETATATAATPPPPPPPAFSPREREEMETIIHEFLVQHPEVLLEASRAYRNKEVHDKIVAHAAEIFNDASDAVGGNVNGPVTLVEFYDYQCTHCKAMNEVLEELIKQEPRLRVVYKQFPLLGSTSTFAARAVMAAKAQGKFHEYHSAIMQSSERLQLKTLTDLAGTLQLDLDKFQIDLKDPALGEAINRNYRLGEALGIRGTPSFIIGRYPSDDPRFLFIPGKASAEDLLQQIRSLVPQTPSASGPASADAASMVLCELPPIPLVFADDASIPSAFS